MASAAPVLEIRDLTVRYGARLATWSVSLEVRAGEVLALVGESGAGKSTVGRAVVRLLPEPGRIETGAIRLEGHDLLDLPQDEMRRLRGARIALVPQDPLAALNPAFRIGLQATDALVVHRGLSRQAAAAEMAALLGRMGIPGPAEVMRCHPHELSGGLRQRVLIAIAFSCAPALVVADEPTTALDATTQAQILRLLAELQAERGVATLFVTHDLGVVAHLAHRVGVMYAGCLVEVAPTPALFATPAHPYTRRLLAEVPRVDWPALGLDRAPLDGAMPALSGAPRACPFRERCPERFAVCDEAMPALVAVAPDHLVACHARAGAVAPRADAGSPG